MAIPSGTGTEVIKNSRTENVTNSYSVLINGVADHIYIVISIIFTEVGGADELLYVHTSAAGDSTRCAIMQGQSLPSSATFIWNDKFVLTGTEELHAKTGSSATVDVVCSYIDQDWT